MVKKHKGARRQILQLEDKKPSRNEWEPTSTASLNKEASPLDSQVADFFKEIDALTVNERGDDGNSEAACSPSEVASCSKQKDPEETKSQDGVGEKSDSGQPEKTQKGPYCPWQEICDESTGYNYYWNVETNEVTWDCPSEYIIYLKNLQSSEVEEFPQSNQSNSNEVHKKSKKKKDPPQPPEGAIIPISYFGDSSSDESSDGEKENGFGTTTKNCHNAEVKFPSGSKQQNCKKDDSHYSDTKKEPVSEIMGPHLPQDNHFSKKASSSRTPFLSKEAEISSKNEVEEYLEIGPQLPSNSQVDLSNSSECNAVSDSSSKCSTASHSVRNGPTVASTTYDEPWEVSLMNIERKFKGLDQDIGEESPDSTVRKGDTMPENNVPCQTSNDACGIRGVVEYDNFTDEEEEMSSSNISSSKQESVTSRRALSSGYRRLNDRENMYDCQRKFESNKSEVSQSESQRNLPKRKFFSKVDEYEDASFKKSKQKDSVEIVDRLFNSHANSGKYGFGFSRQEQLNLESDFYCSTSSHHQFTTSKGPNDYKAISFVKSDHVFDLSTLNKNISPGDNLSHSDPSENEPLKDNENIYAPGPSGLNGIKDFVDSKESSSSKSNFMQKRDSPVKEKYGDIADDAKPSPCISAKTFSSSEKKEIVSGQKDVSSSRVNENFFRMEEDIDEIDRALCEALEAKKAESAASKPSSSSSTAPSNQKKNDSDSSISKKTSTECAKPVSTIEDSLLEDIMNLSSVLIDKLTFLITTHPTLTTLGSLLIQIQTRLIDWQSGSLDSKYFMSRLQEVQQYVLHYEVGGVLGDWNCIWDRENKRYFYLNSRTRQYQWTYPEELSGKENWMPSSTDIATTSTASSEISVERDELQTVSSSVPEGQLHSKSSNGFSAESSKGISDKYSDSSTMWLSESSPPPPPPGVDSPPPPPPHSPPPDSPPPPPPDSTEVEDLLEDMDIENSDDSNPPLIVTNSRADTPADALMQFPKFAIPSPERSSENFTNASVANAVSSTSLSGFEDMNTVSKSPQLVSTSRDTFDTADSVNMHWSMSQPSCSTDVASNFDSESEALMLTDPKLLPSDKDSEMSASSSSRSYVCSNEVSTYRKPSSSYPSTSASTSSSSVRKEKKKTKLSPGLALKKKNIPSLVEKWQKIKEEQDKEDKNTEDPRNSNSF